MQIAIPVIVLIVLIALAFGILLFLYLRQEKMIFLAEKLPRNHVFNFPGDVEERFMKLESGETVHALQFRVKEPKGIVFYFHGKAGSLASWGQWASVFQEHHWDVLMYDYRGYGKSTGWIHNETQLHVEAEEVFNKVIPEYHEKRVILYGRSLGTGIASKLATLHQPESLVLCTPYFNFDDVVKYNYPLVPVSVLLKYKFKTNEYLKSLTCPIYLLHGTEDELVPYASSVKLNELSDNIELTTIKGATHSDLINYPEFREKIEEILV